MNLFGLMDTSGSAMQAERLRAEVVAANMANAETTRLNPVDRTGGSMSYSQRIRPQNSLLLEHCSRLHCGPRTIRSPRAGFM